MKLCWYEKCENFNEGASNRCIKWNFPDEDCIVYRDEYLKLCYINNMKWESVVKYVDRESLL